MFLFASRVLNSKISLMETRELNYGFIISCHSIRSGEKRNQKTQGTSTSITGGRTSCSPPGRSQPMLFVSEHRDNKRIKRCKQFAALGTPDSVIMKGGLIWPWSFLCFYTSKNLDEVIWVNGTVLMSNLLAQEECVESSHDWGLEKDSLIKQKGICWSFPLWFQAGFPQAGFKVVSALEGADIPWSIMKWGCRRNCSKKFSKEWPLSCLASGQMFFLHTRGGLLFWLFALVPFFSPPRITLAATSALCRSSIRHSLGPY